MYRARRGFARRAKVMDRERPPGRRQLPEATIGTTYWPCFASPAASLVSG